MSKFFRRRKFCKFTAEGVKEIDYKDLNTLRQNLTENGKIVPSVDLVLKGGLAIREHRSTHFANASVMSCSLSTASRSLLATRRSCSRPLRLFSTGLVRRMPPASWSCRDRPRT